MLYSLLPVLIALLLTWVILKVMHKIIGNATNETLDDEFRKMCVEAVHYENQRIECLYKWLHDYQHTEEMENRVWKAIAEHEREVSRLIKMQNV